MMHISDKINMDCDALIANGPITIVAFGDSVTHGAVAPGEINYETVYWNRLRQKLNAVRNYVPVNVINAGIGGITAKRSLDRIDRDVLKHEPDLVIVCFGLNDVNGTLDDFVESLRVIFARCQAAGADVIFMTPNMLNTYVAATTVAAYREYAAKTAEFQTQGRMDQYMVAACTLAGEMGVPVCDCYNEWKKLAAAGIDTTMRLANRINHPLKEMHELFAQKLFEIILPCAGNVRAADGTMFQG